MDTCRKITYWIVLLICLWLPVSVQAPTIPYEPSLVIIQGNSIKAVTSPINFANVGVLAVHSGLVDVIYPQELIRKKYPEMANLLICILEKESSYCQRMRGDKGLAYGCFQIHIDKHNITEWCAMDFECSLDFTAQKIKEGKGYLWSTYLKCKERS